MLSFIAVAQLLLSQPMNFSAHPRRFSSNLQSGKKLNLYFQGLLLTSHSLNLQHWAGFLIHSNLWRFSAALLGFSRALFLHFGGEIARSPHVFFPQLTVEVGQWAVPRISWPSLCCRCRQTACRDWQLLGCSLCMSAGHHRMDNKMKSKDKWH